MALRCHQILEAEFEKGRNVPDYQPADCHLEADHVPLVDSDAGHLLSRAELRHEPLDPEPEVDDDEDVEEGEEEPEHVELVGLALVQGTAVAACTLEHADSSSHRLRGEGSLDDGCPGEDGVHDQEERADDDPVELVEQPEVRSSLPYLKQLEKKSGEKTGASGESGQTGKSVVSKDKVHPLT